MQVEGYSLLIGRHIPHSAFSLADTYSSQSDEEEVWEVEYKRAAPYRGSSRPPRARSSSWDPTSSSESSRKTPLAAS
jgi:hypothetical protein